MRRGGDGACLAGRGDADQTPMQTSLAEMARPELTQINRIVAAQAGAFAMNGRHLPAPDVAAEWK
ncbi:MAG: hypothetical protein AMXMBFR59_11130 [Rhodanobacteraceae bacterium]